MRRAISTMIIVLLLCASCSVSLGEELGDDGIIILDEEWETSSDEIDLEEDDFDLLIQEIPEELDLLDVDLTVSGENTFDDPELSYADNAVSNDAPSGIMNNGEDGIYIDINASPYTDFAMKSYGSYAYGTQGCAWFASARLCQVTGIDCVISSGTSWYNERYAWYGLVRGTSFPNSGKALVCYGSHIAVIEKLDGDRALISEGGEYYSSDAAHGYCIIHWMDVSDVKNRLGGAIGYVYFGRHSIASGQCGDGVYWDLYEDKVLEIHGSGAMWDWDYERDAPWKQYSNDELEESLIDKVIIDTGVTTIGSFAFDCSGVREFSIADTVTSLGKYTFNYCYNLSSISLPDGIEAIPDSAFFESAVSSIKLPKGLKIIEGDAFGRTDNLKKIVLPDNVREIRGEAFFEGNLESITIPANVELIDSTAFDRCDNLATIKVNKNNDVYCAKNNVLYTKEMDMLVLCAPKKTGDFVVPDGIIYIGKLAFGGSRLSKITLPDGLKMIGDLAFHGAFDLESINIPSSIEIISDTAFLGWSPDGGLLDQLTVYAPYGSYAHNYCRLQDANHNTDGFVKNYIITLNLSKTGSNGKVTLRKGEKIQLIPVGKKGNLTIKSCKTRNSKVAKINSKGVVMAVGKGETKITVQPKDTKAMTLTVKVIDPYTPTGVKLNKSGTVKLAIGKTLQLKATVSPSTAETTLTWSSSNSRVAKVSKTGKVTGVKKGTATITVKTKNGKTAKVKIKVEKLSGGGGGGDGW